MKQNTNRAVDLRTYKQARRATLLSATISFGATSTSLFVLRATRPASGYELSIYAALPSAFWVFLTLGTCAALSGMFLSTVGEHLSRPLLAINVLALLMNRSLFLTLPSFRGYFLGFPSGWDVITHIAEIKRILFSGHTSAENFYPLFHVLGAMLSSMTSVPAEPLVEDFPVLFLLVYFSSVFLLARRLGHGDRLTAYILIAASPLLYSYLERAALPSMLSLFMVPTLLYLWHKRSDAGGSKTAYSLLVIVVSLFITFTHPVTAFYTIFAMAIVVHFYPRLRTENNGAGTISPMSTNIVTILVVTLLAWYLSYSSIVGNVKLVTDWFVSRANDTLVTQYYGLVATADLPPEQLALFVFYQYGGLLTYLLLGVLATTRIIRRQHQNGYAGQSEAILYAALFLTTMVLAVIFLFTRFIEYDLLRIARFPILFATVLIGLELFKPRDRGRRHLSSTTPSASHRWAARLVVVVVVFLVMGSAIVGVFNVYGSSNTYRANEEITNSEASGVQWIILHGGRDSVSLSNLNLIRLQDLFLCFREDPCKILPTYPAPIPSHFGYGSNLSLAGLVGKRDGYMITTTLDHISTQILPPAVQAKKQLQYLPTDFADLEIDASVNLVYSNGDLQVWVISGGAN